MLYTNFVRAYTHTLRLHMMCTPFLVYMYAFTYDVHDFLVYTYVIHSYTYMFHYCMIVYFPLYFQVFLLGVYERYT